MQLIHRTNEEKPHTKKRQRHLVERELFVIGLLVFGASMSTLISAEDSIHFALAWTLATTKSVWLNGLLYGSQAYTVHIGGHTLSALPPGLAFFTFEIVGISQSFLPMDPTIAGEYIGTYLSCVFGALALLLFYKTARMFGSERSATILSLVFAFGTSLWFYSRMYLPEALATFLGVLAVYCALRASAERPEGTKRVREIVPFAFLSGLSLSLAVFADNMLIFFFVPIFLYLVFRVRQPNAMVKILSVPYFLAGTIIGFVPIAYYDYFTTGNIFSAPYGQVLLGGVQPSAYTLQFGTGLYDLLLNPVSGLLFFTPFILVSLVGLYYFGKERTGESIFFAGMFLSALIPLALQSQTTYLHNTVGPSELIIGVPYLLLPAIGVLNRFRARSFWSILSCSLGATSILITGIIALTGPALGAAESFSTQSGSNPLVSTNFPLFLQASYLTWWSFFAHPELYALLILIFPIVILIAYSTRPEVKIRRGSVGEKPMLEKPVTVWNTRTQDPTTDPSHNSV
jgi:hypothetical protein